jgi:6-phosphofructokinase 1
MSSPDFQVKALGERKYISPLGLSTRRGDGIADYVYDDTRVLYQISYEGAEPTACEVSMERAGPRELIYFDPGQTRAAMVTCGGLSPGLNNVIRSMFLELHHKYKVAEVIGFRYGFRGINPAHGLEPITMTPEYVRTIHNEGGSVLGSSRGGEDIPVIVDTLTDMNIDILFCVGGDGTLKGAHAIAEEIKKRRLQIAVIGVPKTIDNDIPFVYKTFGFDTAVGVVREALQCAHTEAQGTPNGVGLVKVMGRDSGFIAAYGTLASMEVNFCLIPEVPFDLHGEGGLLDLVEKRLRERGHAVILVSEGAGQYFFEQENRNSDASGNVLHRDIGLLLKDEIKKYLAQTDLHTSLKYIDPSYIIRSVRANASDAIFCENLARNAVHAGMAGKSDVVIGLWNGHYVHVPIPTVTKERKKVHPESYLWRNVVGATGQPIEIKAKHSGRGK